ncbi:synaptic vesicle glycoprotein 2B isoform X2 [Episyrphus balteatus]|uniref:synaptic vesicle glycoprotein 2B isoform X2 n=1 Tax=Episyrphus balteatus TaxID=286459 RepID=UPI002486159A|nr:synaptic vesicle glycoprotein 2B isoform X2 [Episyrphus balteatus]
MPPNGFDVHLNHTKQKSLDIEAKKVVKEWFIEDALNLIGFGRVQWEILFVSGVLLMMVLNESMGMSMLIIAAQCEFDINSQEKSIMSAACFTGILLASFGWGYLSDISGRRTVLIRASTLAVVFSLISMFVSNFWVFVVSRFLTGIGIAGASAAAYPYLGEFNTAKYRPIVINYASIFVGISAIYCPVVAWLILPQTWTFSIFGIFDFRPWRLLILFNLLPGLIGSIWIWTLPETPKLYLSHGKDADALKVLYWIYERNTGKPSKDFQVKRLIPEADKDFIQTIRGKKTTWEIAKSMWKQTLPLFKPPHALNYCVCCFVMFGLFFSSSGMGLWYPEIQNRLGFGTVDSQKTICGVINQKLNETIDESIETVCNDEISTKTYIDSITLGGSYVVAYLLLGLIINPLGRKAVLSGALGISGACGLALQWVDEPTAIVILFCGYLMLSGLCVSVMSGSVVDLIPTHLRGKAVCICLMIGRLGSVVGNNIIGAALETYCEVTFYIFSILIILCSLLTLVLPI